MIQRAMSRLLSEDQESFRSRHDIVRLLNDPTQVFSYSKLMQRTDSLLRAWTEIALGEPRMAEMYLPGSDSAAKRKEREKEGMKRLQQSRARLSKNVVDPLPRAAAIAERARRAPKTEAPDLSDGEEEEDDIEDSEESDEVVEQRKKSRKRKGGILDLKESAERLDFSNVDEDENLEEPEEEEDNDEAVLPTPEKIARIASPKSSGKKARKSQMKKYEGRRTWTEAETSAIKQGIEEFGWGKWALIKEHYKAILKDRTSGQIKVCGLKTRGKRMFILLDH
jgi:hypothetical protein